MSENAAATTQPNTDGADKPIMIPKARFDEVNNAKKSLEERLASITAKEEAARQEQLKAQGKFEELEAELKGKLSAAEERANALAVKAAEYEAQQTAAREAQIATLPEAHREIASALPADKLPAYVALVTGKAQPVVTRPGEPGAPVTTPTGMATPEEIRAGVKAHGTQWLKDNATRIA